MTKPEKMKSIETYLRKHAKYFKNYIDKNGNMDYLDLVVCEGIPDYISYEWSSFTSPLQLCDFGEKIGYPLRSIFGDYDRGTAEWSMYHYRAKSEEDGSMYYFCRPADTNCYENTHCREDVKKVDCLAYDKYVECH